MTFSSTVFTVVLRFALLALAILFAGCQSAEPAVAITCPEPPALGSAPIAAYDAYALAIKPQVGTPRASHTILISSR